MRAERLATAIELKTQARSLIATERAAASVRRGVIDTDRLQHAVELDPKNHRAREMLAAAQLPLATRAQSALVRWASSAVVSSIGLLAVVLVLLRRGSKNSEQGLRSSR